MRWQLPGHIYYIECLGDNWASAYKVCKDDSIEWASSPPNECGTDFLSLKLAV